MFKKLYGIINQGCDDVTRGITELNKSELKKFCEIIDNLNMNSTYGCMPTIHLYEVDWDDFREVTPKELVAECDDDSYVREEERFWCKNKCYTFKNEGDSFAANKKINLSEVINGV